MKAIWNQQVVAESDDTRVIEGNHYFPPDSLHQQYFRDSNHTSRCGWKGTAKYFHLEVDGKINRDAAWTYPETLPKADVIRGRVAFWRGVQVVD